jgi:hypothetical protein
VQNRAGALQQRKERKPAALRVYDASALRFTADLATSSPRKKAIGRIRSAQFIADHDPL